VPWLAAAHHGHYVLKYTPLVPAWHALSLLVTGGFGLSLAGIAAGLVVVTFLLAEELLGPNKGVARRHRRIARHLAEEVLDSNVSQQPGVAEDAFDVPVGARNEKVAVARPQEVRQLLYGQRAGDVEISRVLEPEDDDAQIRVLDDLARLSPVGVDTLGPACSVPRKSVVDTGKRGTLYFMASDENSGVKKATITIVGAHGRVLRTFVERTADWASSPPAPYFWMRFKCTLKPGTYRVEVHATDWAGNRQVTVGHNILRVVRSGAPDFSPPWWPSGLGSSFSSRLNHGLRPAWLLRQPGSPTIVRAASHRGAWQARHWPEIRSEH